MCMSCTIFKIQRVVYHKSPIFTYPQLGVTLFAFHQDVRKLENIWAIVWHC